MEAQELLKLYAEGRRDFRSQDLRGLSFKGQNLSGTDFSECDIRGTNFSKADLTGAKFVEAKAGLQKQWVIGLLIICFPLSALSGFITAIFSALMSEIFSLDSSKFIMGCVSILLFCLFNFFFIYREVNAVAVAFAFAFVAFAFAFDFTVTGAVAVAEAFIVAGAVAGPVAGAVAVAGAFAIDGAVAFAVAGAGAFIGAVAGAITVARAFAGAGALIFLLLIFLYTTYIGGCAIKGDSKYILIREIAVVFAAIGGTTFNNAILTNTDFTKAILKNTDFRKARLSLTCFKETKKLDLARSGNTYLKNREIQELVQTGQVKNKNFDYQDLQGIYLKGANLSDASFIGANLNYTNFQNTDLTSADLTSADLTNADLTNANLTNAILTRASLNGANLYNANLSNAKLVQAQLDKTDFTDAILTGAYIEDWSITRSTKFDGVRCKYVYMRLPTKDNDQPIRKPDNEHEVFADGEFGDFIKPIFDTLDLYHTQNIDPRAIAIALKNLAKNNPDAQMEIKAMEKRGNNFLIRLAISLNANRSKLSAEYFKDYNKIKLLNEQQQARLSEKDDRIKSLENMIVSMMVSSLNKPTLYAENYHNHGNTMSKDNTEINIGSIGGNAIGIGNISGTVTATIGQLAKSEAPEAPKLVELLKQLQLAIESDTHLSEKDKAKALKQVQALAEAGQNPKDEDKKDLADTAITMLKGIVTGLPGIAAAATACKELLPLITSVFGL